MILKEKAWFMYFERRFKNTGVARWTIFPKIRQLYLSYSLFITVLSFRIPKYKYSYVKIQLSGVEEIIIFKKMFRFGYFKRRFKNQGAARWTIFSKFRLFYLSDSLNNCSIFSNSQNINTPTLKFNSLATKKCMIFKEMFKFWYIKRRLKNQGVAQWTIFSKFRHFHLSHSLNNCWILWNSQI